MGDWQFDNEAYSQVGTVAAGKVVEYPDSTTKKMGFVDDGQHVHGILSRNNSTASQGAGFAADTYVTGSGLLIPSCGMQAGQWYQWTITGSKTAAGIAAAVYTIRIGTNQTTADTSRLALTAGAQTAAADNGILTVSLQVRSISATGVIAGGAAWAKTQAGTAGLGGSIDGVGATFDNTALAGSFVGLSINGGTSAAWTLTSCVAVLMG